MTESRHAVMIVRGLNDQREGIYERLIGFGGWEKDGLTPFVYRPNWHDGEDFKEKLKKGLQEIEKLHDQYGRVSVVGCSAGGSFAGNMFGESKLAHKMVNNCGRMRKGEVFGFRGFIKRTATSYPFAQSVVYFEESIEPNLTTYQRGNIMTITPLLGDELVPANTVLIRGARNITLPLIEHGFTIAAGLFSRQVREFLKT